MMTHHATQPPLSPRTPAEQERAPSDGRSSTGLRQWWRRRAASLPARITSIAMLPVLALALLVGGVGITFRYNDLDAALRKQGLLLARMLASSADYGVFSGNVAALQGLTDSISREPGVSVAAIVDADLNVLAISGKPINGIPLARQGDRLTSLAGAQRAEFRLAISGPGISLDDLDAAPRAPPSRTPQAIVVVSTDGVRRESQRFALLVIAMLASVLLAAGWVARRMSQRISRPLMDIAKAVERVGEGRLGVLVEPSPIEVVNRLGSGVNEMARRLEREMRQLEDRVRDATGQLTERTEEAERANRAKSRFLAAASHDLRQPMHALGMFVAALREQPSTASQRELMERIERAVAALGDLLDSLLDISRLDAGAIEPQLSAFSLQEIFERIKSGFAESARRKNLDLIVRRSPEWVVSDRILLERILTNLVSNAIRYTDRGVVMVAVRITGTQRDQIRIEVRDSGPGIPDEAQQQVFEEFVQLGNPERDRSKGLGLGLAIVRRLVTLLDHRLVLHSRVGAGSRFCVSLPRASEQQRLEATDTSNAKRLAGATAWHGRAQAPGAIDPFDPVVGARLLVIDDDAMVRDGVAHLLRAWGAEVAATAGDLQLPERLRRLRPPDLIICDLRLADGLDGVTLIANIRAALNQFVPAVLVTGDTDPQRIAMARASGDPVVHKPLRPAQTRAVLYALLKTRRSAPPEPLSAQDQANPDLS